MYVLRASQGKLILKSPNIVVENVWSIGKSGQK